MSRCQSASLQHMEGSCLKCSKLKIRRFHSKVKQIHIIETSEYVIVIIVVQHEPNANIIIIWRKRTS